jgi:hypothetical protein
MSRNRIFRNVTATNRHEIGMFNQELPLRAAENNFLLGASDICCKAISCLWKLYIFVG